MTEQKTTSTLTPAMKIVIGVVGVLVIAGAGVASALMGAGGPLEPAARPATAQNAADPALPNPGATVRGPGAASTAAPTRGPLPEATPRSGSEVLPPTAATPGTHLPRITPAPPLVPAPLPSSAARNGGLVKGFPTRIMGPVAGSQVVSSSVATQGPTMQVSLVAVASGSRTTITQHYEKAWVSLGMQRGRTSDGTITYIGAHESVTLAFGSAGTGNRYVIYGVFRTE